MKFQKGHNINIGRECKAETKQKIRLAHLGMKPSQESIEKNRQAHLGKHPSEETIKKIRIALSGKNSHNFGKHYSEDLKKKLSEAHKGQIPWNKGLTKEDPRVMKYVEKMTGRKQTEETRRINSLSHSGEKHYNFGKHLSVEVRQNISQSQKGISYETRHGQEKSNKLRNEMSLHRKGIPLKGEHRKKVIQNALINGAKTRFKKESIPWNKGRPCSEETKRKSREAQLREKSHCWINGSSYEPYGEHWTRTLKNKIRKRDNQVCMNCGKHREQLKEALHVHHINYDKTLCIPQNLISLCRVCHAFTRKNREYWTKLFQEKLSQLYGYKYENGKIILKLEELN